MSALTDEIQAIRERAEKAERDVALLIGHCKKAIPEAEHPADPTVSNWCWQLHALGEDRRAAYRFRAEAEADLASLRARVTEYLSASERLVQEDTTEAGLAFNAAEAALRAEVAK